MHDKKEGRRRRNKYDLEFAGRIAHEREMDKEIAMVPPRTGGVIQVRLEQGAETSCLCVCTKRVCVCKRGLNSCTVSVYNT